MEALEDRLALAVCTFLGAVGNGEWSLAGNWQGGIMPVQGRNDSVIIDATAGSNASKADIPNLVLADLELRSGYGGTLFISDNLEAGQVIQETATRLNVWAGAPLSASAYEMHGGTLDGLGSFRTFSPVAGAAGTFDVAGNSTIGVAQFTIDINCLMAIAADVNLAGTQFTNLSDVAWLDGDILVSQAGGIRNYGTFDIACANLLDSAAPAPQG